MATCDGASPATPRRPTARVVAVAAHGRHDFSKTTLPVVRLVEGLGVEGDAHHGATVQHLSRVRRDPGQPNLRQVHLIACELFEQLLAEGHRVGPGQLGENVTTAGLDLLALPVGALLGLGATAEVAVTGLRTPCRQVDVFQPGLLGRVLRRDADGSPVRRAGIMGVVRCGGDVRPGDAVVLTLPKGPHRPLQPV
jgi:MOSC domain-containing protein YiiM